MEKLKSLSFIKKKKDMSFLDEMKFVIASNLELIICQKCNLACEHCMRGEGSNKVISDKVLDATFQKFNYIDNLALGGGDPSLVPETINKIADAIIKNKTIVKHVNLTTNGAQISDEFIQSLLKLKKVIESKESKNSIFHSDLDEIPVIVCFSFDDFHLKQLIEKGYSINDIFNNVAKVQKALNEKIEIRIECDIDIINSGRAKDYSGNIPKHKAMSPNDHIYPYYIHNHNVLFGGIFTISCDGEVVPPNIPFKDEIILSFGNIVNQSLSKTTANMNTKKLNKPEQVSYEYNKLLSRMSSSKLRANKYLKSVGYKKLNIIYSNIEHSLKELGEN